MWPPAPAAWRSLRRVQSRIKCSKSIFSALALSPGGVSQNHMTDFLKTVPTRNLFENGADAKSYRQHSGRTGLKLHKPNLGCLVVATHI